MVISVLEVGNDLDCLLIPSALGDDRDAFPLIMLRIYMSLSNELGGVERVFGPCELLLLSDGITLQLLVEVDPQGHILFLFIFEVPLL